MSGSTLIVLVALWAVVLLPRALRDVRRSPVSTVTGFNDAMARLAVADQRLLVVPRGGGRCVVVHPRELRRGMLVRRRRAVLVRLLAGVVGSLLLAAAVGGWVLWSVATVAMVVLAAYCAALRSLVRVAARRREPVAEQDESTPTTLGTPAPGVDVRTAAHATARAAARVASGRVRRVTRRGAGTRPVPLHPSMLASRHTARQRPTVDDAVAFTEPAWAADGA